MSKKAYTAAQFDHVEGLEAVQLRPGMFVSDAGDAAVEVLFREVLDNSIDEAMNGHGNLIEVTVVGDRVTVRDRGRGIPIEPHPKHPNISVLEVVLTKLHSGAKLRGEYGVSGGLHGIGLKALTALAENLEVEVRRGDGNASTLTFVNGIKQGKIQTTPLKKGDYQSGTAISWRLSKKFLPDASSLLVSKETVRRMLRERSYMNAGLQLTLKWEDEKLERFLEHDGLAAFALELAGEKTLFAKAAHFTGASDTEVPVEVAITWTSGYGRDNLQGFCNCVRQPEGGTHLQGLRMSLPQVIRAYIEENGILSAKDKGLKIEGADCFEGVHALVAVRHRNPVFKGQAKTSIANTDIQGAVQKAVNAGLAQWLEENPKEAKALAQRAVAAAKARVAASKAREQVRKQDAGTFGMKNFGKLKDCSSKDASKNELFIVEGK
jgi:DNA gyrase subunit B